MHACLVCIYACLVEGEEALHCVALTHHAGESRVRVRQQPVAPLDGRGVDRVHGGLTKLPQLGPAVRRSMYSEDGREGAVLYVAYVAYVRMHACMYVL